MSRIRILVDKVDDDNPDTISEPDGTHSPHRIQPQLNNQNEVTGMVRPTEFLVVGPSTARPVDAIASSGRSLDSPTSRDCPQE